MLGLEAIKRIEYHLFRIAKVTVNIKFRFETSPTHLLILFVLALIAEITRRRLYIKSIDHPIRLISVTFDFRILESSSINHIDKDYCFILTNWLIDRNNIQSLSHLVVFVRVSCWPVFSYILGPIALLFKQSSVNRLLSATRYSFNHHHHHHRCATNERLIIIEWVSVIVLNIGFRQIPSMLMIAFRNAHRIISDHYVEICVISNDIIR